jgi:hypothetical protein
LPLARGVADQQMRGDLAGDLRVIYVELDETHVE